VRAPVRQLAGATLPLAFDDLSRAGFLRVTTWLRENPSALPESFSWTCDNVGLYRKQAEAWIPYKVWRM
jgi:hypothetical protein